MNIPFDIYEYFNSRDIAEHCRNINYKFSAIETAYIVWHSNHHTLAEKHEAWQTIIDTLPDEQFNSNWDFNGHSLHSFLQTYMELQNEFIEDFRLSEEKYIYTYETLYKYDDRYYHSDIFYDSYEMCFSDIKANVIDDDIHNKIANVKILRHRLHSSHLLLEEEREPEAIVFNSLLSPAEVEPADYETDGDKKFLGPSYGFYEMWVAIPTPFRRGDIVIDVHTYDRKTNKRRPLLLNELPYWAPKSNNGDKCGDRIKHLLNVGVDSTDMKASCFLLNDNGELHWFCEFDYLNLEYYRGEFVERDKPLFVISNVIQGKITANRLLINPNITK